MHCFPPQLSTMPRWLCDKSSRLPCDLIDHFIGLFHPFKLQVDSSSAYTSQLAVMAIIKTDFRKHSLSSNSQAEDGTIDDPPKKRVRWRSNTDAEDEGGNSKDGGAVIDEEEAATFDRVHPASFSSRFLLMGLW
jgi:hypothetical protein